MRETRQKKWRDSETDKRNRWATEAGTDRICTRIKHWFPGQVVRFSSHTAHTQPASLATR